MPTDKPRREYTEAQMLSRMAALCSRSERCEADIVAKLRAMGAGEEAVASIIARLRQEHFIDDGRYARAFVRERSEYAGWGRRKIEFALRRKGIEQSAIEAAIDELNSTETEEKLRSLLAQKNRSTKAPDAYSRRGKLIRFALSRGFDMDLILKCLPNEEALTDC